MKRWKLSHTDVCDCGERQTMSHLMICVDAPNCTWTDLAMPTLAGVNYCQTLGGIYLTVYRGLDEEAGDQLLYIISQGQLLLSHISNKSITHRRNHYTL